MSDFLFSDHGSVIAIVPLTSAAISWIDDNVVSEPGSGMAAPSASISRYARDLQDAIAAAGLSP